MTKIVTSSEKQTFNLGKKLAKELRGSEIVALIGELGAGKTILIKGIAAGLGIKKNITSPSFVLMKLYKTRTNADSTRTDAEIPRKSALSLRRSALQWLCHVDAYRLKNGQDLVGIGLKDWLGKPGVVTVIEWADRVKKILPRKKNVIRLKIGHKKNERIININKFTNLSKYTNL